MGECFLVSIGGESHPRYLLKSENKLMRYQRRLSKKRKCSNNRAKARLRVARLHKKIAN
ncbi:Transposase (plasmid) [Borrelia hermsii YBT]|uniref:Transposase n=1 Tax=Borrelia hermsii YBT TaxID=1313295 RepID=W5T821_BORHE|nr:Transposase [Borrelia hermsii YBT]